MESTSSETCCGKCEKASQGACANLKKTLAALTPQLKGAQYAIRV